MEQGNRDNTVLASLLLQGDTIIFLESKEPTIDKVKDVSTEH